MPYLNRNTKVVPILYPGNEKLHPHFDLERSQWRDHNSDQCQLLHKDSSQECQQKPPRALPLPHSS